MKRILFFVIALSLGFQAAAQDTLKKVKDSG